MRYDTPIYFQLRHKGEYNMATGDYGEATVEETLKYAKIMDASESVMKIVYGKLKQGSFVIKIQSHYDEPFDFIRKGNKRYKVDRERRLKNAHAFVVSEVQ